MNNSHIKTYPVAGAAYITTYRETFRTHAYNTTGGITLCKNRVKPENLLFDDLWDGPDSTNRCPTCRECAKKDPRFKQQ